MGPCGLHLHLTDMMAECFLPVDSDSKPLFCETFEIHFEKVSFPLSVQFSHSIVSDSLRPHESQHAGPPCPSPTPGVYSNSCPSSR